MTKDERDEPPLGRRGRRIALSFSCTPFPPPCSRQRQSLVDAAHAHRVTSPLGSEAAVLFFRRTVSARTAAAAAAPHIYPTMSLRTLLNEPMVPMRLDYPAEARPGSSLREVPGVEQQHRPSRPPATHHDSLAAWQYAGALPAREKRRLDS